jgi:hypothetical protein
VDAAAAIMKKTAREGSPLKLLVHDSV